MTSTMTDVIEIDWDRVEELYAFTRTRAIERVHQAERPGRDVAGQERHDLCILETMYAQARRHDDVAACAVLYFRAKAMKDAQHPDFLGRWIVQTA